MRSRQEPVAPLPPLSAGTRPPHIVTDAAALESSITPDAVTCTSIRAAAELMTPGLAPGRSSGLAPASAGHPQRLHHSTACTLEAQAEPAAGTTATLGNRPETRASACGARSACSPTSIRRRRARPGSVRSQRGALGTLRSIASAILVLNSSVPALAGCAPHDGDDSAILVVRGHCRSSLANRAFHAAAASRAVFRCGPLATQPSFQQEM
jgi:hypothetical protein